MPARANDSLKYASRAVRDKFRKEESGRASPAPTEIEGGEVKSPLQKMPESGFDLVGGGVPGDGGSAEVGLVGHVASQRGVVAEDSVFRDLLMVARPLKKPPEVRFLFIPGSAAIVEALRDGLLAGFGIVLLVPLF